MRVYETIARLIGIANCMHIVDHARHVLAWETE